MAQLSISLLGPFQVALGGESVTDFATDKARALLAYLTAEADRPHRRDNLAGLIWPDQPQRKARQNLRQALSHLRQVLGDRHQVIPFLLISRETVQFNTESDHRLDITAFAALAEDCKKHRHRHLETCLPCLRRMEQMVALYRGDFLAQFFLSDSDVFEEWALLKREWLRREVVEALFHLAGYCERRRDYGQARHYARRQVELEPWREEAHRQLMRLLALDGQRSAALAQYKTCRRALAEELGIEPTDETVSLYKQISAPAIADWQTCRPANLPPSPTSFIGREKELADLAELLADPDCRLVTLVGPGGIGKTRLALRAAEDQIGAFAHGVTFVSLAPASLAEHLVPTIADTLELPPDDRQGQKVQLLNYLCEKEMLLVLDSMEHVLEETGVLAEMLLHAPGVVLLATSRARLNLREEWVYSIGGLTYPKDGSVDTVKNWDAINLFQQRARQAYRRFLLSETETPHVVRICQLVEGMPLGVELAAAWAAVRPCEEIAREVEHTLDVLVTPLRNVPARQQSVRATFEYSWQLLSETERCLFTRLSVFRGGFRQEAAILVAGASPLTLSALLDKSLIRRVSPDRYDMHELLRQYAAQKLATDPQRQEETQMQYARYFAAFLEQREEQLRGTQQKRAFLEIGLEIENVRYSWQLAVSCGCVREVEQSLESLYHFCDVRSQFQEGIDLLSQALYRWEGDTQQVRLFSRVLSRQGALYYHLGRYSQARACLGQSIAIFKQLMMPSEQVFCLVNLAKVALNQGKYKESGQLAQRGLSLSRQIGDAWGTSSSLFMLGMAQYRTGDVVQAEMLIEEGLAVGRESGDQRLVVSPLNTLADIACHQGEYSKAQALFEECLALSRELGNQSKVAMHLNNLGTVLHVLKKYPEAQAFYQESLEICREIGDRSGQAIALSNLGEVAHALGAYTEAQEFHQEGLSIGRDIQDQWTIMACLNNLGETACALEDYQGAMTCFAEAAKVATETQTLTVLLKILVNMAALFTEQGQRGRAAELLGLAHNHPASEQAVREKAERLLDEIGLTPPDSVPRPLNVVVAEILGEISPP
ncbi:MAG: tetratricopeptide repeat protein [Chloroflexota bacterium]|nr:tetratricopeptide repeat protein [Chloroflexota bacterium]